MSNATSKFPDKTDITIIIVVVLVAYLGVCFITLEIDFRNWSEPGRGALLYFLLVIITAILGMRRIK